MRMRFRLSSLLIATLFCAAVAGAAGVGFVYFILVPKLPSVEVLRDVQFQVPLRVYTRDGKLVAEFGEKRRIPLTYEQIPPQMVQAFIAAEDDRFFEHPGVDYQGIARAIWNLVLTGERSQGGSTITMQVARNFFLSSEKTYLRKANEILLALKIEQELSKQQILELYLNKIYLGNRAYGVGAAAQAYYGKPAPELTLAEMAMIAGLPKAPSAYNPLANAERAQERRSYVLRRMRELGFVPEEQYRLALETPVSARHHGLSVEVEAPYVAEMVRAEMVARHGAEQAYTGGYQVFTTVDSRLQTAATAALRGALLAYDERHGYRGAVAKVDLDEAATEQARREALRSYYPVGDIRSALVLEVGEDGAQLLVADEAELQTLPWQGMRWARSFVSRDALGPEPAKPADVLAPGDIVRVRPSAEGWRLTQIPEVAGALVALAPADGALAALVGGFDFYESKFNRATQALRQPGSALKPFIYSAALEKGFTPATVVNDAPVVFRDAALEGTWRPENYSGRFYGPTRLREALTYSRNLVSIRVLQDIGVPFAIDHVQRFGFAPDRLARNLSLSLGNASISPLELASGYTVFANGGFKVSPYFIERIEGADGEVLFKAEPARACEACEKPVELLKTSAQPVAAAAEPVADRVISPQNAYLMTSMMRDVARLGTARRLRELGRSDLAGKTGTTNDQRDAWFAGFNDSLVATAWVGFDQVLPLGAGETGSSAALPMWLEFMRSALKDVPERPLQQPDGLITVRIDPETGLTARADNPKAVFETFYVDSVPPLEPAGEGSGGGVRGPEKSLF
jgi:penicillin-binding protein 1A